MVAINKQRASTKLVDKAYEYFKGQDPTTFTIFHYMMKCIHKGENYHPGNFMLKKYVEEVELRPCENEEEVFALAQRTFNSLWR